nr:SRPBCC family protein [Nocardioides zeae]
MLPHPPDAVATVLLDLAAYVDWWPQVVAVGRLGDDDALVLCRSTLPYDLELHLRATERALPRLEVAIGGDLVGTARFTLVAVGAGTRVDYRQEVDLGGWFGRVPGPVLRLLDPLLRWNHARMMAGCVAGLRARVVELAA